MILMEASMRISVLALFLLSACAQVSTDRGPSSAPRQTDWQSYIREEALPGGFDEVFPDTNLLKNWQPSSEVVFDKKPPMPSQLNEVPLECRDKRLWPTHPQQYTKEYLHAVYANYDTHKLPINSSACRRPNPTRRYCLQSTWANMIVMSDTFEDACGHRYRGYWLVAFLDSDESMGTLLSKGRTVYPKANAQFSGDYEEGQTYPVPQTDFLLLTPLRAGDSVNIKKYKDMALAGRYRLNGREFVTK